MSSRDNFLKELRDLLSKYKASIGFTCDASSDTYGLSGDGMAIDMFDDITKKEIRILQTDTWWIDTISIDDAIK